MCVLSSNDIIEAIRTGELKIEPFDERRVTENGIDLTLSNEYAILKKRSRKSSPIDVTKEANVSSLYDIKRSDEIVIPPNERMLLVTNEWVELGPGLMAFANLKSTLARLGLIIPPTVVDAGFRGQVVIEVLGSSFPIKLKAGTPFLHLIVTRTCTHGRPYSGRYQGQTGVRLPSLPVA